MLNHNYLYDTINNKKVITVSVFSCAGSDTIISDRCFYIIITYYLYVSFVSADGHFRRHIDLKLSCYIIVYLQTAGVKYCY